MKAIAASLLALGLLAGTAQARTVQDVFTDLQQTAPKSLFDQIQASAPRSAFEDLRDSAPRSPFDDLRDSAPRSDGVFGDIERTAP